MRRSFRMGLWLGLLAGVLVAVFKVVQTRRGSREWDLPEPAWPRAEPEPMPTAEEATLPDLEEPGPAMPEPIPEAEPVPLSTPAPAAPAPTVDTAPVETATESAPVESAPVESAPVESAPAETVPTTARKAAAKKTAARRSPVKKVATRAVKAAKRTPAKKAAATARKASKKAAKAAKKAVSRAAVPWVEPRQGVCPTTHPVKAKLSSGRFHLPGMAFYDRTRPDRCYADEASAVRDGLTRSRR